MRTILQHSVFFIIAIHSVKAYLGVIITNGLNQTQYLPSAQASFGPPLPTFGISGVLIEVKGDGCDIEGMADFFDAQFSAIAAAPGRPKQRDIIAMIPRGNCSFDQKVYNAQIFGANAVIIYNSTGTLEPDEATESLPQDINAYSGLIHMTAVSWCYSRKTLSLCALTLIHLVSIRSLHHNSISIYIV
jgi:hypothetical protein